MKFDLKKMGALLSLSLVGASAPAAFAQRQNVPPVLEGCPLVYAGTIAIRYNDTVFSSQAEALNTMVIIQKANPLITFAVLPLKEKDKWGIFFKQERWLPREDCAKNLK
jgi:hypothetical protein